ncbi:hypothetical protein [Rurimicrobium arvi]|uniref:Uncharacterized protein n=1 Tax=Rurimicrobium arvi TaxID=2049916 RepID=A0ABP8MV22_9BACT
MKNAQKDTGHLRNCTAFEQLVLVCSSIGNRYRPSNPSLALAAISDLSTKASQSVNDVMSALNNYYMAVDQRSKRFGELPKMATRVLSYFRSCGASAASVSNVLAYNRKLQGAQGKTTTEAPAQGAEPVAPAPVRSTSQRSFDQQAQHFLSMVDILVKESSYQPLEEELSVSGLSALHQQLLQSSLAVADAERLLAAARDKRNQLLYAEGTGIASLSAFIRAYIRAAFGQNSHEYQQAKIPVIKKQRT